jgi:hypothetical protein
MAYQTSGKGPIDLVWQFDFLGDVVEAARVEGGQPFKRTVWSTTR